MKCFITGSNGFIGSNLAYRLASNGHEVICLVRSPQKSLHSNGKAIQHVVGDIMTKEILNNGMHKCDWVFHLAAYAKPWSKDKTLPYKINVEGTENVLDAALKNGVGKVILTSSAAVIGPSGKQSSVNENTTRETPYFNEYEETKALAEEKAQSYILKGLNTVVVNPTRVFGPGPLNQSNSVTKMLKGFDTGAWRILPGDGSKTGNYVFIDDVVNGHILAAEKGISGERYILGGENVSFNELFHLFAKATGKNRFLIPLPVSLMISLTNFLEFQYRFTSIPPPLTSPWVKKYLENWNLSSEKAIEQLGYSITPLEEAIQKTLNWLRNLS